VATPSPGIGEFSEPQQSEKNNLKVNHGCEQHSIFPFSHRGGSRFPRLPGPQTVMCQVFLSTPSGLAVVDGLVVAVDVDVLLRRRFGKVVAAVVVYRRFGKTRDVAPTRQRATKGRTTYISLSLL
jgi:hypothetical protein